MRLPIVDRDMARIDEERAATLIRSAVSRGVTYLDTAYSYHGGHSEPFVGRLLAGGLRDRVQLATKLPTWVVQAESVFERLIDEQLRRLETDRIDFYVFHALAVEGWETVRRYRGLYALERARSLVPGIPVSVDRLRSVSGGGLCRGGPPTRCLGGPITPVPSP